MIKTFTILNTKPGLKCVLSLGADCKIMKFGALLVIAHSNLVKYVIVMSISSGGIQPLYVTVYGLEGNICF